MGKRKPPLTGLNMNLKKTLVVVAIVAAGFAGWRWYSYLPPQITLTAHEGAYAVGDLDTESGLSVAMKFTVRSIIKMVREVTSCG